MPNNLSVYETAPLDFRDMVQLLKCNHTEISEQLYRVSAQIKEKYCGNIVYLRGLIEYSNICTKNCYYCGIRKGNAQVHRYTVTEKEVLSVVKKAYEKNYGSIVIQSGERKDSQFIKAIDRLVQKIKQMTNGTLGITLSVGEQSYDVYKMWRESGAERYLLRIETSDETLYKKIHPNDPFHSFVARLNALEALQKASYQTGTGVMIGLPFQTEEHLARDLMFMKDWDIDMCGMGPYLEHKNTPLRKYRHLLPPKEKRFEWTLKMIALLRIIMKDINIAATTAMQTIAKDGRIEAIRVGANVMMPNITPYAYRDDYWLYENKPATFEAPEDHLPYLEQKLKSIKHHIGYGTKGNSPHYYARTTR